MADDALTCFTSLLANVPTWIADLETIIETANAHQSEFKTAEGPSNSKIRIFRKASKSSSMKSKRSRDEHPTKAASAIQQQLRKIASIDALRKKQPPKRNSSIVSGDQSGPSKYRVRGRATIYYDGEIQKSFEKLVRGVGACRNAIRKGKMTAKVDALSRTGSSSSDCSSESEDFSPSSVKLTFKSTQSKSRRISNFACDDGTATFDTVDARLEKAQTLCEHAAHQLLRDGDCLMEVTNAKELFTEALELAEAGMPDLRRRAQKAIERRRRSEERRKAEEEAVQRLKSTKPVVSSNLPPARTLSSFPSEGTLEVDELEVDDDEEDDEEAELPVFNINAISMGKFGPIRSTRTSLRAFG